MMRQITNIVLFDIISNEIIDIFSSTVSQYLDLYLELSDTKLRMKHHNLLHYSQLMRKFGPLKYMSSIRFEGKHKMFKNNSKVHRARIHLILLLLGISCIFVIDFLMRKVFHYK